MSFQDTILYHSLHFLVFRELLQSEVSHHTVHSLSLIIFSDHSYRCVVIFHSVL